MSGRIQKCLCGALVCRGGDDGAMSVDQMTEFINNKQRDPRLNEILYPPLRPAQTHTLMERYQHDKTQLEQGKQTIPVRTYTFCWFVFINMFMRRYSSTFHRDYTNENKHLSLFLCSKNNFSYNYFLYVSALPKVMLRGIQFSRCLNVHLSGLFYCK